MNEHLARLEGDRAGRDPVYPHAPAQSGPVLLAIPADRGQVTLVRSVAGHFGARLGLSVAQLTDLQLAVAEACSLFLLAPGFPATGMLECRFENPPQAMRIMVSAVVAPGVAPDVDDIGWIMLGALVDELTWQVVDGIGTVTLFTRLDREA